jgi:uncharacterized membrane protein YgcG
MRFWHRIALAALALLAASPALADERILDFSSAVAVQPDGALDVEEKILVRVENAAINHGIFRDFPTRYRGRAGARVRVDFKLIETRRDGQPEPSATEAISNGIRVRIGSADAMVPPGEHLYTIQYRTDRQIGRFADYDELYWNVTGNGWEFPIDRASVRIALPGPAKFGQRAVYTGPLGSTDSYGRVMEERAGEIAFQTTAPLGPHEGFTVAVAWPKGVIAAQTSNDRARYWLSDYGPTLVGALALLGLLAYYFYAWKRVGRGPIAGTVVPIFSPPDDLTPAAMRYVWKMKADNRSFAAALVDMGVRGHIKLVEKDGGWLSSDTTTIERTSASDLLPTSEQALVTALFAGDEAIEMDKKNHGRFSAALNGLSENLKETYEGKLFLRNWSWSFIGLGLFIAALGVTAVALMLAEGAANSSLLGLAGGAVLVAILCVAAGRRSGSGGRCALNLVSLLAVMTTAALILPMLPLVLASGRVFPLLLPMLALPFVISAFAWMAAPTKEGRGVLDRIAGFRQYLSIAERNRLDRMTAPTDTLERFERFLPYAIALGVETRWAKRFQSQLAAAAIAAQHGGAAQGFAWYSGSSSPWDNPGGFAQQMGSSLSSAISSASTAPGSSSGSGGGGSSGGGGGGGGGGGW